MVSPFRESGNAIYQVTRASASDEGIYTCNATSPSGSKARTTLLDISGRYQRVNVWVTVRSRSLAL